MKAMGQTHERTVEDELNEPFVRVAKAIRRPAYAHRELLGVDRGTWVLINLQALEDWYRATGDGNQFDEDEFRRFCWCQYDADLAEKERFEREYGSNYDREPRYRP